MLELNSNYTNVLSQNTAKQLYRNLLKQAVALLDINLCPIRVKRDDDDFEKIFNPVANKIDTASINNFHSWNLLNGAEYKDYLYDVPLGVDSDGNGVSDGWVLDNPTSGNITSSVLSDNAEQSVSITSSTSANDRIGVRYNLSIDVSTDYSIKLKSKVSDIIGDFNGRVIITNQGFATLASAVYTNTEYDDKVLSFTTGVADTQIFIFLQALCTSSGDTGSVYFKDAILVKNSFIEDIGLFTADDDSDGVANGWTHSTNTNTVGDKSVSEEGQFLKLISTDAQYKGVSLYRDNIPVISESSIRYQYDYNVTKSVGQTTGQMNLIYRDASDTQVGSTRYKSLGVYEVASGTYTFDDTVPTDAVTVDLQFIVQTNSTDPVGDSSEAEVTLSNFTIKQTNNSAYVTKIYDTQNGNDAVQTNESAQPRLVNEGVWEVDSNGDITLDTTWADCYMQVDNTSGTLDITSGGISIFSKMESNLTSSNSQYIFTRNRENTATMQYGLAIKTEQEKDIRTYNDGDPANSSASIINADTVYTVGYSYDGANVKIYKDGVINSTVELDTLPLTNRENIQLFARSDGVSPTNVSGYAFFFKGKWTGTILFNKALTESQFKLLTNRLT